MEEPNLTRPQYRATRQKLLRDGAALGALATLPGFLAACGGGSSSSSGGSLTFWEYKDPPGSDAWNFFQDAAKLFEKKNGIHVDVQFKSAEGIEQAVAAAANARKGFDALLWWSGPTVRNQASLGNILPLDALIPKDIWGHKNNLESEQYNGKQFAMTFVVDPYFLVYNRTLLKKAGVNAEDVFPPPDQDPPDWNTFLDVCGRIKKNAGVAPLMWANKEGYFNEWHIYNFEGQSFDSTAEIENINLGDGSWQNPNIYDALNAYKQLYQSGYFVDGGEVVPYEQHVRQLASGQAAMSVYFDMTGATDAARKAFGADAIGFSKVPAYRTDKGLYGHVCQEADSLYVASWTKNKQAAVKWIEFLVSVPEMSELAQATQQPEGDDRLDVSLFKDPAVRQVYKGATETNQVYPYDFATQAQYNSLLQNGILFLKGQWSAEQLTADWDKVDKQYKEQQQSG
jgi:ABC-type glycerol-3-phosphate transport system substrate-binding protein